jgi:hypothetical protein
MKRHAQRRTFVVLALATALSVRDSATGWDLTALAVVALLIGPAVYYSDLALQRWKNGPPADCTGGTQQSTPAPLPGYDRSSSRTSAIDGTE